MGDMKDFEKKEIKYHVFESDTFDERGETFLALRKIQWGVGQDEEGDPEKAKLEIRKWNMRNGKEMANKGTAFLTEDGPHELTKLLLSKGYGDTKESLRILSERDDFEESVKNLFNDEPSDDDGEYFNPREYLLG